MNPREPPTDEIDDTSASYYPAMRKLAFTAIAVAVLSLGVSGWALWRSYDSTPTTPDRTTPATAASSTTVPLVVVPTEIGKAEAEAVLDLTAAGLNSTVVTGPSVSVGRGTVIGQSPVQGTEVPKGTSIELTVSSGPA